VDRPVVARFFPVLARDFPVDDLVTQIRELGIQLRVDSIRYTTAMPTSGTPAELLSAAGIDADHIAQAVRESV
jgi:hypothetical protein